MRTFKQHLEEGKKLDRAINIGLATSIAALAATTPFAVKKFMDNRAAESGTMSQHEVDAMMSDINYGKGETTPPKPQAQPKTKPAQPTYHHDAIKQMVIQDEGIRTKPYRDTQGILTVGIGHNLQAPNSRNSFRAAFGEQGDALHAHASRGGSITHDQARRLFDVDYQHHLDKAIRLTPNLHEHPADVQSVIVSATYRGHWGGSPAARRLFSQGNYKEAAKELLDNKEFRRENAKTENRGVADRMLRDARVLHDYGSSLEAK